MGSLSDSTLRLRRDVATILAVDRDPLELDVLGCVLRHDGHQLIPTPDPERALEILRSRVIDLAVVEASVRRQDGFEICDQLHRAAPSVPLMLVSEQAGVEQIVRGLQAADDYLEKPFSPRVLLARVHSLLRRASLTDRRRDEILSIGEIELNLIQMHVVINGARVPLTPRELWLLHTLMDNANRVLSRDQLIRLAWGEQFVGVAKTVDVCIQRIRKKLAPHLATGYIHALRGFGYGLQFPLPSPDGIAGPRPITELLPIAVA